MRNSDTKSSKCYTTHLLQDIPAETRLSLKSPTHIGGLECGRGLQITLQDARCASRIRTSMDAHEQQSSSPVLQQSRALEWPSCISTMSTDGSDFHQKLSPTETPVSPRTLGMH